jgi:hypothetical protein
MKMRAQEIHEDYQNFTRGPLKAGDTLRITSFVHYDTPRGGPDCCTLHPGGCGRHRADPVRLFVKHID